MMLAETREDFAEQVRGETDSELLFSYVLSDLFGAGESNPGQDVPIGERVAKSVDRLYRWALELQVDPPKTTFVMTNGTSFIAHSGGMELHVSGCDDMVRIASEPVDRDGWMLIPDGHFVVGSLTSGVQILPATSHFHVTWPPPLYPPPARPYVGRFPRAAAGSSWPKCGSWSFGCHELGDDALP